MNVRDDNMQCVLEMLNQIDTITDDLASILRTLRNKVEHVRRGMEVEGQLSRAHPPDPLSLPLEDPDD